MPLTVHAEHRDDHVLLRPREEVDLLTVHLLDDALHACWIGHARSVVLNLTDTTYLGCCALRPLMIARRVLEATRRHLLLTGARRPARRLLLLTDLDDLLTNGDAQDPEPRRVPAAGARCPGS